MGESRAAGHLEVGGRGACHSLSGRTHCAGLILIFIASTQQPSEAGAGTSPRARGAARGTQSVHGSWDLTPGCS